MLLVCWFDLVVAWLKVLVTDGSWWWLVGFVCFSSGCVCFGLL